MSPIDIITNLSNGIENKYFGIKVQVIKPTLKTWGCANTKYNGITLAINGKDFKYPLMLVAILFHELGHLLDSSPNTNRLVREKDAWKIGLREMRSFGFEVTKEVYNLRRNCLLTYKENRIRRSSTMHELYINPLPGEDINPSNYRDGSSNYA